MENTAQLKNKTVYNLAVTALFSALICVCSFITVPSAVPFTMQIFGVFFSLSALGGKRGTVSIIVYILMGLVGLPVFSGFKGGPGVLFGATGGYIFGFILSALIYWLITALFGEKNAVKLLAMFLSLLVCYTVGTAWFVLIYSKNIESIGIVSALSTCVLPFIIPDIIKIVLALLASNAAAKILKN